MKLRDLQIQNFRGIQCAKFDLETNSHRITGPNGSGKSSFIDAIHFLLTGTVSGLEGHEVGRTSFEEYASHIHSDPEDAYVKGIFDDGEQTFTVCRDVTDRTNPYLPNQENERIPGELKNQMEEAEQDYHHLSRDKLLEFILSTDREREEKIEELLGISTISEYRAAFNGAKDRMEKRVDNVRKTHNRKRTEFIDTFEDVTTEREAIKKINKIRTDYGGEPLSEIEAGRFTDGLESPGLPETYPLQLPSIKKRLSDVQEWFDIDVGDLLDIDEEMRKLVRDLESAETTDSLENLELLELGRSVLDPEEHSRCPLCRTPQDVGELHTEIQDRINDLEQIKRKRSRLDDLRKQAQTLLSEAESAVSTLIDELETSKKETERLRKLRNHLESWQKELMEGDRTALPQPDLTALERREYLAPPEAEDRLDEIRDLVDSLPPLNRIEEQVGRLEVAADRYKSLQDAQLKRNRIDNASKQLEEIRDRFLQARQGGLNPLFSEVSERFIELYSKLHDDTEVVDFSAKLTPTEHGVNLSASFADQGHHDPVALHSEGHQDSMGLCLFLSMLDTLAHDAVEVVLLDDVVMSIDAAHRTEIADLLREECVGEYQVILTTHDNVWDRHLGRTNTINAKLAFNQCDVHAGLQSDNPPTNPWGRIDTLITEGDKTSAAAWIRKTAEWYTTEACRQWRLNVPYHDLEENEITLGDILRPVLNQYEDFLNHPAVTETTRLDQSELEGRLDDFPQLFSIPDEDLPILNNNVHYQARLPADYTREEIERDRDQFKKLQDHLRCPDCYEIIRSTSSNEYAARAVTCECDSVVWWYYDAESPDLTIIDPD
jgi:DNA repair exonuclease SbcCD ATPase subunit